MGWCNIYKIVQDRIASFIHLCSSKQGVYDYTDTLGIFFSIGMLSNGPVSLPRNKTGNLPTAR